MQQAALTLAAILTLGVGIAHSYLGERYILIRLFRRAELPKFGGSTEFTKGILRFAWHLTTVAWWGFAGLLVLLAMDRADPKAIGGVIGATFLVHGAITAVASRGKHLAWIVFLAIGGLTLWATNS